MVGELTKAERIKLIVKALEFCGEARTFEAVAHQYHRETREALEREFVSGGTPAAAQPEGNSGAPASRTVGVSRQDDNAASGPTPERALSERPVTPDARPQLDRTPDRASPKVKRTRRGKLLIEDLF